ncbi:MAG: MoxR family ATPase [Pseudomonadota bacterium]
MTDSAKDLAKSIDDAGARLKDAKREIGKRIMGQHDVVELALVTLLSAGHGLLVGVPGLAKTRLVNAIGHVMGLTTNRVQFTPDLMPADILGSEVMDQAEDGTRNFRFLQGPVFAQLLMADEINRASPRTQSALLQAMQEYQVTVAGQTYDLPKPFHVLATQNPIEQEGTYPLPEAQLDRFILQIDVDFPDRETEKDILLATTGVMDQQAAVVFSPDELIALQHIVRAMPVGESVIDAILTLIRAARPGTDEADPAITQNVSWGPGPRAAQALMLATRARALIQGRLAPSVNDVLALAVPVLTHRMALSFTARAEGVVLNDLIDSLATRTLTPDAAAA